VSIHEVAHFLTARRLGLKVDTLGLGIPIKSLGVWEVQVKGVILRLSPLLLLAYAQIPEEEMEKAGALKRILICVTGPLSNIISGLIFSIPLGLMSGKDLFGSIVLGLGMIRDSFLALLSFSTVANDIAGPIGIVNVFSTDDYFLRMPLLPFFLISLLALSTGIGIINLVPIPPLDGGRIILDIPELIFGKNEIIEKAKEKIMYAGGILLLILMVVITARDIFRVVF
jgi:regulator of sigma E protease